MMWKGYLLFVLFSVSNCWATRQVTAVDVEYQLEMLKQENLEMRKIFVSTVARLEQQLQRQAEQSKTLQEKVDDLEKTLIDWKKRDTLSENQVTKKSAIYRTCTETKTADPSLSSGMYWIDPDGLGVGDSPIYVYCNLTTGSTAVPHDSEGPTDVGHCADPGCYSNPITYQASARQIAALIELSSDCQQSIKYDCNYAPLEIGSTAYSWWNDKAGQARYFWAGSNSSVHTCQCGIDHNCIDPMTMCNCDANLPIPQTDDGVITNKDVLPITRVNFGRTVLETSSGVYNLGRLICSGQKTVQNIPASCEDLWRIGNSLSGLYSVAGTTSVDTVYCDFKKLPSESSFQTWIGKVDIKSRPTYFHVGRTSDYSVKNTPVPYQFAHVNAGLAMDLTSGIFTAPRAGFYYFSFSGSMHSSVVWWAHIQLVLNHNVMGLGNDGGGTGDDSQFGFSATLQLQAGDNVWVQLYSPYAIVLVSDFHFTGGLVEEVMESI